MDELTEDGPEAGIPGILEVIPSMGASFDSGNAGEWMIQKAVLKNEHMYIRIIDGFTINPWRRVTLI
jgi:hypothetical protein